MKSDYGLLNVCFYLVKSADFVGKRKQSVFKSVRVLKKDGLFPQLNFALHRITAADEYLWSKTKKLIWYFCDCFFQNYKLIVLTIWQLQLQQKRNKKTNRICKAVWKLNWIITDVKKESWSQRTHALHANFVYSAFAQALMFYLNFIRLPWIRINKNVDGYTSSVCDVAFI